MCSKLDAFLIQRADSCQRLVKAFADAEKRFWERLGKVIEELLKNALGRGGKGWEFIYLEKER